MTIAALSHASGNSAAKPRPGGLRKDPQLSFASFAFALTQIRLSASLKELKKRGRG
jgi:hypothetical protein